MNSLRQLYERILNYVGGGRGVVDEQVQRLARQAVIGRALRIFSGLVERQLKVEDGQPDDNVFINYAEVIVNKGVSFLFGKPLKISVGSGQDDKGEQWLERVWPQAQRDEEFQEMAEDGGVTGDAYLKISIEPDGSPRVTVGDPNTYELVTDPHDMSRIVMFRCVYPLGTMTGGKQTYFKEETRRAGDGRTWQIDQYEGDGEKSWTPAGQSVTWNFPFPPIFHCKNLPQPKSVYGKPDLTEPVLRLIEYISRLDSMCGKIVRLHSSPKPWAKNLKPQDLQWGTGGVLFLQGGGGAGAMKVEQEIGLLEMSNDISTALSLRKVLREGLAEMTGVPEVATGKVESTGPLAGVALRILYGPLLDKTSKKQLRYGRMIVECVKALLVIGGIADAAVKPNWPDPLPGDEKEKVDVAEGKKRLGVSEDTLQRELGYDPKHEREQSALNSQDTAERLLTAFDRGAGMEREAA